MNELSGKNPAEQEIKTKWKSFLKDVFLCSLGAYGGPEAHFSVMLEQMVTRKKYLTEEEFVELIALCSILPGPTSTQTIVSIGYKKGGPVLALFTMLVWALPVLILMTVLSFLYQFLSAKKISYDVLRYIGPVAVGFIIVAALRIGKKVIKDMKTGFMMIASGIITYLFSAPWVFPVLLFAGGMISILSEKDDDLWNRVRISPPWHYFISFALIAIAGAVFVLFTDNRLFHIFESFYRYGYLVFGGGQVVVPLMHTELVSLNSYMTNQEFLTGYGLVQGFPGPMFSFAAYAGGMAARGGTVFTQLAGAVLGGIGIFLPGLLLIYFIFPVWEDLKKIKAVKVSLKGINAVAGGLIAVAAVTLTQAGGLSLYNLAATAVTVICLISKKIPAPVIVAAGLAAGFIL